MNITKYIISMIVIYVSTSVCFLYKLTEPSEKHLLKLKNSSITLVIAHPDDETMFFGPTIMNLYKRRIRFDILCVTNGGADGFGDVRTLEMQQVTAKLDPQTRLSFINNELLPDGMDHEWDKSYFKSELRKHFEKDNGIKSVITFDNQGVSHHPNHVSISKALNELIKEVDYIKIYQLKTIPLYRKYTSFLDSTATHLMNDLNKDTLIFANTFIEYIELTRLLNIHRSQMVWFRRLYMLFSRYMYLNDLNIVEV